MFFAKSGDFYDTQEKMEKRNSKQREEAKEQYYCW
jgi:hypothetical protein